MTVIETNKALIWSGEHGAWWRPNSAGYTSHREAAGVYEIEEARRITSHCGPEKKIEIQPICDDGTVAELWRTLIIGATSAGDEWAVRFLLENFIPRAWIK